MLFSRAGGGADYEALHVVQDRASGLRAIVALHRAIEGRHAGGIRRMRYGSEEDALADALRLSSAMTAKLVMAGAPAGGGKTVILDHAGLDAPTAYRALGRAIDALGGRYLSGPDVGTGEAEMEIVRAQTPWANPRENDAGASTAEGVLAGIRGTLRALDGSSDLSGRVVLVQGLGSVGLNLARGLIEGGASVLCADLSPEARRRAEALGAKAVPPQEALSTACDVLAPCALGGILTRETAERLPARAVCGSANNQLADSEAGRALHRRGVLYAPDFVVNCGAAVEGVFTMVEGAAGRAKTRAALAGIEARLGEVFRQSRASDAPTHDVAMEMVAERLA